MKKIKKSSELLWLFGTIFVALGVSVCSKANLGVSMIAAPAFVVYEAISPFISWFSVGVTEYIIQAIMLLMLCVVIKKFRVKYLLAFAVAFLYGYVLDFFLWVLGGVSFNDIWLRWLMLIVGDLITAFGVACYFRTYMPLQVYELFVSELSKSYSLKINKTKWAFDLSLLAISIILAITLFGDLLSFNWGSILYSSYHSIGLGTILTTIINSPIIALMGKLIDKVFEPTPLFIKLEGLLKDK